MFDARGGARAVWAWCLVRLQRPPCTVQPAVPLRAGAAAHPWCRVEVSEVLCLQYSLPSHARASTHHLRGESFATTINNHQDPTKTVQGPGPSHIAPWAARTNGGALTHSLAHQHGGGGADGDADAPLRGRPGRRRVVRRGSVVGRREALRGRLRERRRGRGGRRRARRRRGAVRGR